MSPTRPILSRKLLAEALARDLAGESFADYSSGMFLAAPRRTGKTLGEFESAVSKAAKKAGIDKISLLRTLSWDFTKPQLPAGTTLSHALD
eukprot:gene21938-26040_t